MSKKDAHIAGMWLLRMAGRTDLPVFEVTVSDGFGGYYKFLIVKLGCE